MVKFEPDLPDDNPQQCAAMTQNGMYAIQADSSGKHWDKLHAVCTRQSYSNNPAILFRQPTNSVNIVRQRSISDNAHPQSIPPSQRASFV